MAKPWKKTSSLPTRVYRYSLRPPTANADLVAESFVAARRHYNQLVTAENVRRSRYRAARSQIFPEYDAAEKRLLEISEKIASVRSAINSTKAATRSRSVDPDSQNSVKTLLAELVAEKKKLAGLRASAKQSEELQTLSKTIDAATNDSIKALRKTLYWGTYQLNEEAVHQASRNSKYEVAYDDTPAHLLSNRIGVQFIGSISVPELYSDTQMQITNPPTFRQSKSGIWRPRYQHDENGNVIYCMLKFRIGSTDKRKPIWAEFPISYDRPLPADSRIMKACITRRPLRERNPWQYHLCITVESREFERTVPHPDQEGTTAINFGWRQLDDGSIRVATINKNGQVPEHVVLPPRFVSGHEKCRSLQSLLDEKFESTKKTLGKWITSHTSDLPPAFITSFDHLHLWKSQHRLCELVRYWSDHRLPGDAEIWAVVNAWRERYLHLHDWMTNQRAHLLRWRDNFYQTTAKKLATSSAQIVVDTFQISEVARREKPEDVADGGQVARQNRVIAAAGELREAVIQAAAKHHCLIVAAPTANGTRRCNVCGDLYVWNPAANIDHTCPGVKCGATWDQDVNNTDNLLEAQARGEVVPLVVPAEHSENRDFERSQTTPFRAARRRLAK